MATKKPVNKTNGVTEEMFRMINTASIDENDENPRTRIDNVEDLKASIKAHGLLQPIVVRELPNGHWKVIAGSRRFKACKENGMKAIPCFIIKADDEEAYEFATAENIVRENMTAVDEANAVAKLFAQGKSRTEIGAMFGKSARWAEGRRRIVELGDKAMKALASGKINLGHAEVLTMCRPEDVNKWLDYASWRSPEELKNSIMNEKPLLERAPFNAKRTCKNCDKRSDCQKDLFNDITSVYCLDRECFEKNVKKTVETVRKQLTANGYIEVPEDDYSVAMYGWNGYCQVDDDDEDNQKTIKELKEKGAKPMFWIDKDTAEYGIVYKEEYDTDSDDDESEPSEENSWHRELSSMKYERKQKIKDLANQEEKRIVIDKLQGVFGNMKSETKAFILEMIDCGIEDEEGGIKTYLKDVMQAYVDFFDKVADSLVRNWSGVNEDVREYFQMDSREEFERRENEALPEDWDAQNESEDETEESEEA